MLYKKYGIPLLLYALVVIVLFIPAMKPGTIISNGDIARSHYFYMTYLRDSVLEGRLPLWNPYTLLGQPFLANPSIAFWYPPTWIFILIPIPLAFCIHIMFHVWWAMAGMYIFVKRLTVTKPVSSSREEIRNRIPIRASLLLPTTDFPAWIAALIFGLGGYTMAHVYGGNYDVIASGSWIGWVLAGFILLLKKPRLRAVGLAAVPVGFQFLAGYMSMSVYTLMAAGITVAVHLIVFRQNLLSRAAYALLAVALGTGTGMIQLLPNAEFAVRTVRSLDQNYRWSTYGSIEPEYFLQMVSPFPYGGIHTPYKHMEVDYWEHGMYAGFGAVVLALFGVMVFLVRRKDYSLREHTPIASVAIFTTLAIWLAMGQFAPVDIYRFFWDTVPGFKFIRIPGRFVYLIDTGIAALAGFGVWVLLRLFPQRMRWLVGAWLVFVVAMELVPYARQFIVTKTIPDRNVDQEVREVFNKTLGVGERFHETAPYLFWYDAPAAYRILSTNGYDVTMLRGPYLFELASMGLSPGRYTDIENYPIPEDQSVLDFLSVRYVLVDEATAKPDVPGRGLTPIGTGTHPFGTMRIYRRETTLPQFRFVYEGKGYGSESDLYEAIRTGSHDSLTQVGFVRSYPKPRIITCERNGKNAVSIQQIFPERIKLVMDSACDAYLTGSHVYFPGWTATVDGKPVPVYEGNLGFLTIEVPAGSHTIELLYHSTYLRIGALLSLLAWMSVLMCIKRYPYEKK